MDEHTLLILLTIFVAVTAVSLFAQAAAFVALVFIAKDVRAKFMDVWPQIQGIIGTSKRTADQAEKHIASIGASGVAILEVTKQQLTKVDELLLYKQLHVRCICGAHFPVEGHYQVS